MPSPTATRELIREEVPEIYPPAGFVDRIVYKEDFQTGRPVLATTLDPVTINQASVRLLTGANKQWAIGGTNAANANSGLDVDGGVLLATGATDNDQIVLSPMIPINSVQQSVFGRCEWEPEHAPRFECIIELPALTNITVQAGLALTTALNLTTDADYAKLQFSTEGGTSTTNWTAATGVGGVDAEIDTGVAPTAARSIRLGVNITSSRLVTFFVNGLKVATGPTKLTAGANFIPIIGIQALEAAAKSIAIRDITLSRDRTSYVA